MKDGSVGRGVLLPIGSLRPTSMSRSAGEHAFPHVKGPVDRLNTHLGSYLASAFKTPLWGAQNDVATTCLPGKDSPMLLDGPLALCDPSSVMQESVLRVDGQFDKDASL